MAREVCIAFRQAVSKYDTSSEQSSKFINSFFFFFYLKSVLCNDLKSGVFTKLSILRGYICMFYRFVASIFCAVRGVPMFVMSMDGALSRTLTSEISCFSIFIFLLT